MKREPPSEPSSGVVLSTLADFSDYAIRAHCQSCKHHELLEHEAVARRTGWDFPLTQLRKRLCCSACRSRDCGLTISHSGKPHRRR